MVCAGIGVCLRGVLSPRQILLWLCAGALVVAPAAAAGMAPVVSTGGVKAVTATSATLTGTVNPEGEATTYYFQYGTSTAYGSTTPSPAANAGSGTMNVNVSAAAGSLTPNITYHYRLVATNASGTSTGADHTFKTNAAPPIPRAPAVSTGGVKAVTATSATLTGTVNPEGEATTYYFQYGTSTAYGSTTPSPAANAGSGTMNVNVSAAAGSLTPNITYHYRLVATNASGTSTGADHTFKTTAAAATPRAPAVSTGGVRALTATSATLTGTVNPEGQAATYYFQYGTSTAYGSTTPSPAANAGAGTMNVNVSAAAGSLTPNTTYHYRLVATNASGTSTGADHTFKTNAAPPIPRAPAVSTGGVKALTATSPTLTGTVNPEGQAATYYFQYGTSTAYGSTTPSPAANAGSGTMNVNVSAAAGSLTPNIT